MVETCDCFFIIISYVTSSIYLYIYNNRDSLIQHLMPCAMPFCYYLGESKGEMQMHFCYFLSQIGVNRMGKPLFELWPFTYSQLADGMEWNRSIWHCDVKSVQTSTNLQPSKPGSAETLKVSTFAAYIPKLWLPFTLVLS